MSAEQPANGPSTNLWIAAGVALLALVAAAAFLFGRRRRPVAEDAYLLQDVAPAEAPLPPEPAAAPSAHITIPLRRHLAETGEPQLEIVVIPKRAGTNLMSVAVDYRVIVRNIGTVAARDVNVGIYLFSASAQQAQDLQLIFTTPVQRPAAAPFAIEPGQDVELGGMALLPREQVNVMTIEGKPWFVPVLAIKAEYRWGENVGAPGVATAAHMIGIDRGEGAKMAPFRLDGGPHMHPEVAERKVA